MEPKEKQGKLDQAKKKTFASRKGIAGVFLLSAAFHKNASIRLPLVRPIPTNLASSICGSPGREVVSRRLTEGVPYQKTDRFLPSVEKVKKLKEKPRERTAVIFFTDLLGVLRKSPMTPRSFSFRFLFFFQKEKEEL